MLFAEFGDDGLLLENQLLAGFVGAGLAPPQLDPDDELLELPHPLELGLLLLPELFQLLELDRELEKLELDRELPELLYPPDLASRVGAKHTVRAINMARYLFLIIAIILILFLITFCC